MRKLIVTALVTLSLVAGAGTALSAPHDPRDDNPNNDHGQCTAFFNGQKKGHPVWTTEEVQDFYDSCKDNIGGNPDENGRYTDCFTDTNNDSSDDCSDGS